MKRDKTATAHKIISKTKLKFIKGVGIELEGGWIERPGFPVHSDGSVSCEGDVRGESHTEPKSKINEIFDELKSKYPQLIDESCGMHVHVSLSDFHYSILTDKKFFNYFMKRMVILGEYLKVFADNDKSKTKENTLKDYNNFISRMSGNNRYCKKEFIPESQVLDTSKSGKRYTMLNFCHGLHGTMECRMFPMFYELSSAKMAVREFIDCIEEYLRKSKEEEKFVVNVYIPNEEEEMELTSSPSF